jgi:hypothetical protein
MKLLAIDGGGIRGIYASQYPGLWLQDTGKTIVQTLNPCYLTPSTRIWEDVFKLYRTNIVDNLQKMRLGFPARGKWEWAAEFFNNEVKRQNVNVPTIDAFPFPP